MKNLQWVINVANLASTLEGVYRKIGNSHTRTCQGALEIFSWRSHKHCPFEIVEEQPISFSYACKSSQTIPLHTNNQCSMWVTILYFWKHYHAKQINKLFSYFWDWLLKELHLCLWAIIYWRHWALSCLVRHTLYMQVSRLSISTSCCSQIISECLLLLLRSISEELNMATLTIVQKDLCFI